MDTDLVYKPHSLIEDLKINECTIHRAGDGKGARWWNLWFYVKLDDVNVLRDFVVAVNPGGNYSEHGPAGRTWGFVKTQPGVWLITPSINIHQPDGYGIETKPGAAPFRSLWHHTPRILGVPDKGEPWMP
jgi:hypothetical protein